MVGVGSSMCVLPFLERCEVELAEAYPSPPFEPPKKQQMRDLLLCKEAHKRNRCSLVCAYPTVGRGRTGQQFTFQSIIFMVSCYFPLFKHIRTAEAIQIKLSSLSREAIILEDPCSFSGKQLNNYPTADRYTTKFLGDLKSRALQWLNQQAPNIHLSPITKISICFPRSTSITNRLDIIIADAEGMMFYTGLRPIFLISRQFWSWLKHWATLEQERCTLCYYLIRPFPTFLG